MSDCAHAWCPCPGTNCSCGKTICSYCGKEKTMTEDDPVRNPKHYQHPSGVECIEIVRHHDFNTGGAIKYLWRAGKKDPDKEIEDLEKAVWLILDRINYLRGRND